jgi:flagellar biosynthetic protein FlhB
VLVHIGNGHEVLDDEFRAAKLVLIKPVVEKETATEIAVAIKYDAAKMEAPIVLAKGKGPLAARIRRVAVENGIPIVEKKPLAQALYRAVKVGQAIPTELYEGVAEILAYLYRLTKKQFLRA